MVNNEKKYIEVPYHPSAIKIEKDCKDIFLGFHSELMVWIDQEFEIASEGKAVRFNKK